MQKLIYYILAFSIILSAHGQTHSGSDRKLSSTNDNGKEKLNIIFFLVDDLGYMDVGYNGSSFYETPNVDRFAKEGVRFTQAYAACHVCSPTRASIMTGKYPARINLTDWLPGRKEYPFQKLKNVTVNQQLPLEENTLAEALKANGYSTAIIGKWHLGEQPSSPLQHGFDVQIPEWNKCCPNKTYFSPYGLKGLEGGKDGEYLTDRLTDEALRYIEEKKDVPFFLYLSHFAVHDPIQGRPDLVSKYEKKLERMERPEGVPFILEVNPDSKKSLTRDELNERLNDPSYEGFKVLPDQIVKIKQHQDNVQFAAMVESMDESLGRVLSKLDELGLDDKTIVIFFSDNGGMSAANFGNPARVISESDLDVAYATSSLPLRGGKGWLYEGGIREPMIVKWAGEKTKKPVVDVPVISTDFYPSILEMAGLPLEPDHHMDGISFAPLLRGKKQAKRDAIYWHFPHYSNHGMQSPGGAIRSADYKLLEYYENNSVQLFNLKSDPGEQHDISRSEPEKVKELTGMLHAWRKNVSARMMPPNPDFVRD